MSLLDDVTCSSEDDVQSPSCPSSESSSSQNGDSSENGSLHAILKAMARTLTSSIDCRVLFHYKYVICMAICMHPCVSIMSGCSLLKLT